MSTFFYLPNTLEFSSNIYLHIKYGLTLEEDEQDDWLLIMEVAYH